MFKEWIGRQGGGYPEDGPPGIGERGSVGDLQGPAIRNVFRGRGSFSFPGRVWSRRLTKVRSFLRPLEHNKEEGCPAKLSHKFDFPISCISHIACVGKPHNFTIIAILFSNPLQWAGAINVTPLSIIFLFLKATLAERTSLVFFVVPLHESHILGCLCANIFKERFSFFWMSGYCYFYCFILN